LIDKFDRNSSDGGVRLDRAQASGAIGETIAPPCSSS
jgi:hypothetical protein